MANNKTFYQYHKSLGASNLEHRCKYITSNYISERSKVGATQCDVVIYCKNMNIYVLYRNCKEKHKIQW